MSQKLYCYVDETGQDTTGQLFIVSLVVTGDDRESCGQLCRQYEIASGKGKAKWIKAGYSQKLDYVSYILHDPYFSGRLYYAAYRDTTEYLAATVKTIGTGLAHFAKGPYAATVFIDGLPKELEQKIGLDLRKQGADIKKVRGLADEREPIIRLADSLCGLARSTYNGQTDMQELLDWAIRAGVIIDLS